MPWSSWSVLWGLPASAVLLADVVYYAEGPTLTNQATDLSQNLTNATVGAGGLTEASSSRMLQNDERTIDVRFYATNADSGWYWSYGGQRLTLTAGGTFSAVVNSSTVLSVDASAGFSGSLDSYLVSWSMRSNPGGSGSTAKVSEINVWNLTSGRHFKGAALHATPTATLTTAALWAQNGAGANAFTGTREAFRFSVAWHSATETYEEMAAQQSAPTILGETRTEYHLPTRGEAEIGDDGYFAGPLQLLAAKAVANNDLRLAGPLVNQVMRSRPAHHGDLAGDESFVTADVSGYLYLHWLSAPVPIPPRCNRAVGRAFVQQYRSAGSDDQVSWALVSMSQPGPTNAPSTSPNPYSKSSDIVSRTTSDGSGATQGAWIDFDPVTIQRDADGCSYFAIAVTVVDVGGVGTVADQRFVLKALTIDPIYDPSVDTQPTDGE